MTASSSRAAESGIGLSTLTLCGLLLTVGAALAGVDDASCPRGAIDVLPGNPVQAAVDQAGEGAVFCLKSGIHRAQAIRPRARQMFYGEAGTILNGSLPVEGFAREADHWVATSRLQRVGKSGECVPSAPACDRPQAVFRDDQPLTRVLSRQALKRDEVYIDEASSQIYLADDPATHKIETTVAKFAFESVATDVVIRNLTVEKYGTPAQRGAIHAREGARWLIENCVVRLNSGAGISVGTGTRVHACDIYRNGQIGIEGDGKDIVVDGNHIWSNNIYGFDPGWEGGGVKIAESAGVVMRGNHVHDNVGPGLWCDIECRDVVYEDNLVENNEHAGIFQEISFNAVIRRNVLRHNGRGRGWFWDSGILVAASQDVEVTGNIITVEAGACGIMLIDQARRSDGGRLYKTRDNTVSGNDMTFEGAPCAGGASDTKPADENFAIIENGNNRFDNNTYRVRGMGGPARFVWGHEVTSWAGFRRKGLEPNGRLIPVEP